MSPGPLESLQVAFNWNQPLTDYLSSQEDGDKVTLTPDIEATFDCVWNVEYNRVLTTTFSFLVLAHFKSLLMVKTICPIIEDLCWQVAQLQVHNADFWNCPNKFFECENGILHNSWFRLFLQVKGATWAPSLSILLNISYMSASPWYTGLI